MASPSSTCQDPGEPAPTLGPAPRLHRQVSCLRGCLWLKEAAVTWKSCGLSDSSFLGAGVLFFLLPPGW